MNPTSEQAGAPQAPASPPPSLESRIANIFGDGPPQKEQPKSPPPVEAQAPAEPESDTPAPEGEAPQEGAPQAPVDEVEEIEFEGERYALPKGSKIKDALLRQSDYTRKTQELAEQRKLIEHQQAQFRVAQLSQEFEKSVATERQQLSMIDAWLQQQSQRNWAEMTTDAIVRAKLEIDQYKEHRAALEAEIGKKQEQFTAQVREQMQKLQTETQSLLKSRIPSWNEQTAKEVREWALSNGFTNEELANVHDPRHAEVLWKAAQYDKTRTRAVPAVTEAKAAKVTSSNPMPQQVKEYLNYRKAIQKLPKGSSQHQAVVRDRVAKIFGG